MIRRRPIGMRGAPSNALPNASPGVPPEALAAAQQAMADGRKMVDSVLEQAGASVRAEMERAKAAFADANKMIEEQKTALKPEPAGVPDPADYRPEALRANVQAILAKLSGVSASILESHKATSPIPPVEPNVGGGGR